MIAWRPLRSPDAFITSSTIANHSPLSLPVDHQVTRQNSPLNSWSGYIPARYNPDIRVYQEQSRHGDSEFRQSPVHDVQEGPQFECVQSIQHAHAMLQSHCPPCAAYGTYHTGI